MVQKFGNRIFALLIGIDEYKEKGMALHGCVRDCKDMDSWLREVFTGPIIESLYNEEATKAKIIEKIQGFASNVKIQKEDPILIFFAGHGTEVDPLDEWQLPSDRKVQMRIPHDFIKCHQADQAKTTGQGILDRELAKILADVSSKKGDNITIILDSCSSASGTRDDDCLTRGITLRPDYAHTAGLDKSVFIDEYGTDFGRASSTTPTNHVLLAACREDSFAYETRDRRGAFTCALTKKLREANNALMTYDELILSMDPAELTPAAAKKLLPQYPHCDSLHKDRLIFTIHNKDSNFQVLRATDSQAGSSYYLWLGLTHNVRQNTPILIFNEPKISTATYIGRSNLHQVVGFQSKLEHPSPRAKTFAVLGISSPVVDIFISDADIRDELAQVEWLPCLGVRVVDDDTAPLRLIFNDSSSFELKFPGKLQPQLQSISCNLLNLPAPESSSVPSTFPELSSSTLTSIPGPTTPGASLPGRDMTLSDETSEEVAELLLPRLQQIGHFYYHLNDEACGRSAEVDIQCTVLHGSMKTSYKEIDTVKPCENGHFHILAGDRRKFGLKITNNTGKNIYFSLFYFSESQYRIDALYNPPTVSDGHATFCLLKGEYKTIGYGTPGDRAWQFSLNKDQEVDIGYLKLYWSHEHLDLLHLKRSKILWSTENRTQILGRDMVPEEDEEEDPYQGLPNLGSQSSNDRESIKTSKIALFQFRTLPKGPCQYN